MLARFLIRTMDAQAVWTKPLGDITHRFLHWLFHKMPAVRDLLNGRWLGHPLHAVLTDAPIGILFLVIVFDVVGQPVAAAWALGVGHPRDARCGARRLRRLRRHGRAAQGAGDAPLDAHGPRARPVPDLPAAAARPRRAARHGAGRPPPGCPWRAS